MWYENLGNEFDVMFRTTPRVIVVTAAAPSSNMAVLLRFIGQRNGGVDLLSLFVAVETSNVIGYFNPRDNVNFVSAGARRVVLCVSARMLGVVGQHLE